MEGIPYANVVGSLMYAMVCTGPDIAHAVSLVSRFMENEGLIMIKLRIQVQKCCSNRFKQEFLEKKSNLKYF